MIQQSSVELARSHNYSELEDIADDVIFKGGLAK